MTLNHINLVVSDVAGAIILFETYFDFKCVEIKGDHIIALLKGADGFTLVLMKSRNGTPAYPDAFHIGFLQENAGDVSSLYDKLKTGGIEVGREPGKIRDSFGFYFTFDNIMIEISC